MSSFSSSAEYERGIAEGKKHVSKTEDSWIRATFGPFLWIGIPLIITWIYLKRGSGKMMPGMDGGLTDMFNPLPKRDFRVDVRNVHFSDVVGIPEAVEEIRQYVDFLTNPNKFTKLGARLPKGCLLSGEPGTGKTLLAKAVAGEAQVPFFACNGADFIEIVGGSGPKRVRELFAEARKESPSIVFIDELDGIGSRGGENRTSVSSEENRTVNALLAELDGLTSSSDAVIVIGATNFENNIDKALLREGRFDRKIPIEMPDGGARVKILEHYLKKVYTGDPTGRSRPKETGCASKEADKEESTKLEKNDSGSFIPSHSNTELAVRLGALTPGQSPATLATIVNEAALLGALRGKPCVDLDILLEAVDNILLGKKLRARHSAEAKMRVAVHQAGEALVAWTLPQLKDVLKVSIEARGKAIGYTHRAGAEHYEYQTNATLYAELVYLLAGRAAEEAIFGNMSTGAADNLQRCTELVLKQILAFGMGTATGLLSYHPDSTRIGRLYVSYSEDMQQRAEENAKVIVRNAEEKAKKIVQTNKERLQQLVDTLQKKPVVVYEEIAQMWGPRPTSPTNQDLVDEIETFQSNIEF